MFSTTSRLLVFLLITSAACHSKLRPTAYDPPKATDTKNKRVYVEQKEQFTTMASVSASNQFEGGKLSGFEQVDDSTFKAIIRPEFYPVNNSPWYAFKIWSESEKDIWLQLIYADGAHRYWPKTSQNGREWSPIPETAMKAIQDSLFSYKLTIGPQPIWLAAQEVIPASEVFGWASRLAMRTDTFKDTVGYSHQDRPIEAICVGTAPLKPMLVMLGRQHPPEVSGHLALMAFTESILGDTDLAKTFRDVFEVRILPQLNPDGVAAGHWRLNAAGADLNRDWQHFNQPETRSVKKYFNKVFAEREGPLPFAIDFHSTQEDMFYIYNQDMATPLHDVTTAWLAGLKERIPGYAPIVEATGFNSPSAKIWFHQAFGAEVVTYEVGDETPREVVRERAMIAAEVLMGELLKAYK